MTYRAVEDARDARHTRPLGESRRVSKPGVIDTDVETMLTHHMISAGFIVTKIEKDLSPRAKSPTSLIITFSAIRGEDRFDTEKITGSFGRFSAGYNEPRGVEGDQVRIALNTDSLYKADAVALAEAKARQTFLARVMNSASMKRVVSVVTSALGEQPFLRTPFGPIMRLGKG